VSANEVDPLPPLPDDGVLLESGDQWGWLTLACGVIQTLALIVIAVALVAMV